MLTAPLIMSEKDQHHPQLKDAENNVVYGEI